MFRSIVIAAIIAATPVLADDAKIVSVNASRSATGWQFDVTIQHQDTGWDHYVDAWRILDSNGTELGIRKLAHPHVDEQPFTRSLSGIVIPSDVKEVQIQSRDFPGGWSASTYTVRLR